MNAAVKSSQVAKYVLLINTEKKMYGMNENNSHIFIEYDNVGNMWGILL